MDEETRYCPAGSGKKIKQCRCRDIAGDLEKVLQGVKGGQLAAAEQRVQRLLTTRPTRPCLLALKCTFLDRADRRQELEEAVLAWRRVDPENPMALAYDSLIKAGKQEFPAAIDLMIESAERLREGGSLPLVKFVFRLSAAALNAGQIVPAVYLSHFASLFIDHQTASESVAQMVRFWADESVPLVWRIRPLLAEGPADLPYHEQLAQVRAEFMVGRGHLALKHLEQLEAEHPDDPLLLWNQVLIHSYTARDTADALWRRVIDSPALPSAQAGQALIMAETLANPSLGREVNVIATDCDLTDANEVLEQLLSSDEWVREEVAPGDDEQGPPPKGVFRSSANDVELPWGDDDQKVTMRDSTVKLAVFGRETDREPRITLTYSDMPTDTAPVDRLRSLCGQWLSGDFRETARNTVSLADVVRSIRVGRDDVEILETDFDVVHRKFWGERLVDALMRMPFDFLDGHHVKEIVGQDDCSVQLEAWLWLVRHFAESCAWPIDIERLRHDLGLPPAATDLIKGSAAPWSLELFISTSDGDDGPVQWLQQARVSMMYGHWQTLTEKIERLLPVADSVDRGDLMPAVFALIRSEAPTKSKLAAVNWVLEDSENDDRPRGQLLLLKADLLLQLGQVDEFVKILNYLGKHHQHEPGVTEALERFEQVIDMMLAQQPDMPIDADPAEPTPPQPKIITSTNESTPATGKESKLWIPGQD